VRIEARSITLRSTSARAITPSFEPCAHVMLASPFMWMRWGDPRNEVLRPITGPLEIPCSRAFYFAFPNTKSTS
jgi:hypothetical protein